MADKREWPPLPHMIIVGVLVVASIIALGKAVPPVLTAVGTAIGLAISIATTGLVAGGALAPWVAPVAAVGFGATGATMTILLLVKATRQATKEPFEWVVALLGVGGAALADVAREFAVSNPVGKVFITTLVAFSLVVAAACYKRGGGMWRVMGLALFLLVPGVILAQHLNIREASTIIESLQRISPDVWVRVIGVGVVNVCIAVLHMLTQAKHA